MHPLFAAFGVIYPLACVLLPCLAYQLLCYRRWTPRERINRGSLLWRYALIAYLFLAMRAVGLGSVWDIAAYGLSVSWGHINLAPLAAGVTVTHVLNIVLFMPLGFLLPRIWGRCRRPARVLLAGFFLSLAIELGQLPNHRVTDIDDIIMNVLGTAVGYGVWWLLDRWRHAEPREAGIFPDGPGAYLALAVLGSFLLYNWRWTVLMYQ